jgi:hypothetical protein
MASNDPAPRCAGLGVAQNADAGVFTNRRRGPLVMESLFPSLSPSPLTLPFATPDTANLQLALRIHGEWKNGGKVPFCSLPPRRIRENRQPRPWAGNQTFSTALPKLHCPTSISLARWTIKDELRERRTALADRSSDSYHSSANLILALDPTARPMPEDGN